MTLKYPVICKYSSSPSHDCSIITDNRLHLLHCALSPGLTRLYCLLLLVNDRKLSYRSLISITCLHFSYVFGNLKMNSLPSLLLWYNTCSRQCQVHLCVQLMMHISFVRYLILIQIGSLASTKRVELKVHYYDITQCSPGIELVTSRPEGPDT